MGRAPPESELQINVQPRRHHHHHPPPPPPPRPYQPFKKWFPWLVPLIILANIALFAYAMYVNNCPRNSDKCFCASFLGPFAFQSLRENPLLGPSADTLRKLGALDVGKVVEEHQVWRLMSCMWLHAGVFHVAANMVSLLFVGIRLEQEFGFVKIGLLYTLSGIGGSLASALFVRTTISVGASGALFGLLGAMLSELLTNWSIYENKAFLEAPILLTIGMVMLLQGVDGNDHCSWCHYLSCFPTPIWTCDVRCSKRVQYNQQYNAGRYDFLDELQSKQNGDQLNLTCMLDNKSRNYFLSSSNSTASDIQKLCTQLCS
ncbi:hypothetical protein DM860_006313 [Cuscuta australis]|uniref:RHOMBOID-like protein n=1 Tax=Cuscuta australis TaxID=267555 RepID=A0A328DPA4_9ASTE|nr:hypothetical protein DM860_006313 [Cuscuta australis]